MHAPYLAPALLLQTAEEGLTLAEVIESLPTDPGSLFAIVLMVAFLAAIVYFGTRSGKGGTGKSPPPPNGRTPGRR